MVSDELRREREAADQWRDVTRQLAENEAKLARNIGRIEGLVEAACNDPVVTELWRAQAWLQDDPTLQITRDPSNVDALLGVPDGWPPHVAEPETYVQERVARLRANHAERLQAPPDTRTTPAPDPEPTPSVAAFRDIIGDVE